MKKSLISLLVIGFAGGAAFGLFAMNHNGSHSMNGHCSTDPLFSSICPDGALTVVQHYLSMYQSFTNGVVSLMTTQILVGILLFATIAYVLLKKYAVLQKALLLAIFQRLRQSLGVNLYRPRMVTRWLSLLIHSPSFN